MDVNLNHLVEQHQIEKTDLTKRLTIDGQSKTYSVYKIPLKYLYYNDQNGRINTVYHQYISKHGGLTPESGDSEYNRIFEKFIFESKKQALKDTQLSIKEKGQQEPGVVLSDGRVVDGNRRFTALRRIEKDSGLSQCFEAVILSFDIDNKIHEKKIKELELDLQLGREERVNYDPIDRIFDVYNTIEVQKLMTFEEYKKASGAGNTKGIHRDLRLAELIIKFLKIISPGSNPIDKFYLARELKLDGPIEEIERTLSKLKENKENITTNVLTTLAIYAAKPDDDADGDTTRKIRSIKNNILQNPDIKKYYIDATDSHVDDIIDYFTDNPVENAEDLRKNLEEDSEVLQSANSLLQTTNRLAEKGSTATTRRQSLMQLQDIRDNLYELSSEDFKELREEEYFEVKQILQEIRDLAFKLSK
ncbi:ParB/RepB/Spo0J family partition protein [Streptococcus sobrinus]|uniref:ParB/RepB/Spo0J family partition protein n=1 Tax=Streptococcus sobrinus TaxID=1310 RepID=UPI00030ADC90|nr:ParB/RepB/Spo0J family partition protein [Streptococcus sobrinus]